MKGNRKNHDFSAYKLNKQMSPGNTGISMLEKPSKSKKRCAQTESLTIAYPESGG